MLSDTVLLVCFLQEMNDRSNVIITFVFWTTRLTQIDWVPFLPKESTHIAFE